MGRRRKYNTDEERRMANNQKVKNFYWRNKEKCDVEAKLRYWENKLSEVTEQTDNKVLDKINKKITKFQKKLSQLVNKQVI